MTTDIHPIIATPEWHAIQSRIAAALADRFPEGAPPPSPKAVARALKDIVRTIKLPPGVSVRADYSRPGAIIVTANVEMPDQFDCISTGPSRLTLEDCTGMFSALRDCAPDPDSPRNETDSPRNETDAEDAWWVRLRAQLAHLGWSQAELARRSGLSHDSIRQYTCGAVDTPPIATVRALAAALSVSPGWLMFGDEARFTRPQSIPALPHRPRIEHLVRLRDDLIAYAQRLAAEADAARAQADALDAALGIADSYSGGDA